MHIIAWLVYHKIIIKIIFKSNFMKFISTARLALSFCHRTLVTRQVQVDARILLPRGQSYIKLKLYGRGSQLANLALERRRTWILIWRESDLCAFLRWKIIL